MRELNVNEVEAVAGGVATLKGYAGACAGGAATGAMAAWWTGAGIAAGAGGGCLLGMMGYGIAELF